MNKITTGTTFIVLLSLILSCTLYAQDDLKEIELEKETVIASPIVEGNKVDNFGGQKTVVSDKQVSDLNAQDMSSALRTTPGVNITRYNVIGSFGGGEGGAVFIRGMGSSRPGGEIQMLIDGVPAYNSVWSHPLLDLNPIGVSESIEVYKGPQPALFGNAFGVINMKPKRIHEEGFKTKFGSAYGKYNTVIETAEHGGKIGSFDYYAGQAYRKSDGHRDDADGRLTDCHLNLGYKLSDNWETRVFFLRTDNYAKDPGPRGHPELKDGRYETNEWLTTFAVKHNYDFLDGEVKVYWNNGEGDWLDQAGNDCNNLNDWDLYGVRGKETVHPWKGGNLLIGGDLDYIAGSAKFTYDDMTPADKFGRTNFNLFSPYAAVSQEFGEKKVLSVTPSAGLRYYDHSDFDSAWAPFCGIVVQHDATELHASYARGISYPGLNVVVFSENVIPFLGESWKDLKPEKVDHFEAGISQGIGERIKAELTFFYDDGNDRYVIKPPPPPPPTFENIEDFTVSGIETAISYAPVDNLSLFGGATYLDADPGDLPYAPQWTLSSGMNYRFFNCFKISIDAQYVDNMYVGAQLRKAGVENTNKVDSYFILNSKLSYSFTLDDTGVGGDFFVAGENLTDADYEYQNGYPMPGIGVMGGINLTF